MTRYGIVYYNNIKCGIIEENDDGYVFQYDEYLNEPTSKAISLTLPLSNQK